MKTLALSLTFFSVFAFSAFTQTPAAKPPGVEITKAEVAKIKSYDASEIVDKGLTMEGQIVRIKFNYRRALAEKKDDGSLSGTLSIWRSGYSYIGSEYKYGSVSVQVPTEGATWFMKLPTDDNARATQLVYARIGKGQTSGQTALLLGREIKTDLRGSRIVW